MKRLAARISSFFMTFFMSSLVSVSAVMCFSGTFTLGCDPVIVSAACCGAAFAASVTMLARHRRTAVTAEAVLLAVVVWRQWPLMAEGLQKILFHITTLYARDFPIEAIGSAEGDALWPLLAGGAVIAWSSAWVCAVGTSAAPVGLVCLPVLVSCLLLVDVAPAAWLVLLTGALLLIFMTQTVRSRDPDQGNLLAWLLLAPTAALISAVILLSPPGEYTRADWSDSLRISAETRLGVYEYSGAAYAVPSRWDGRLSRVNLRWLGPKTLTGDHALDYRATSPISYLRGVSLGVYENNAWSAVEPMTFASSSFTRQPQITGDGATGTLDVRTAGRRPQPQLYTAYHLSAVPDGSAAVDDAYLENSQNALEYSITYSQDALRPTEDYDAYAAQNYTQLPEELREPLARYIRDNGLTGGSAQDIAEHVQSAGVYDLNAARVPAGEDFVLYFLLESRRGYCVHFASATVLLLRSQGIASRYVTGYSVSGAPNEWCAVTEDEAHAWVEYYQAGVGWRALDPTPVDWRTYTPGPTDAPEAPQTPEITEKPPADEPQPVDTPPAEEDTGPSDEAPPAGTAGDSPGEKGVGTVMGALLGILRPLLPPLLALLLILLRRRLVLRRRHALCTKQDPNRRLLAYWSWLTRLCGASGSGPEPSLLRLAEKARYSQHTISEDELARIRRAAEDEVSSLQSCPALKRLWHRYGRVLY